MNFRITMLLAIVTLVYSTYTSYMITGSFFGKASIPTLIPYGAFDFTHLLELELWRLFAGQLIHSKPIHMLYNVVSLIVLGLLLEGRLGHLRFFLLWFIAGAAGTLISTFTVAEPWHYGTGGSQAILGLAGFALMTAKQGFNKGYLAVLVFSIAPAFALDLIFAENHIPKPGHLVPLVLGVVYGLLFLNWSSKMKPIT